MISRICAGARNPRTSVAIAALMKLSSVPRHPCETLAADVRRLVYERELEKIDEELELAPEPSYGGLPIMVGLLGLICALSLFSPEARAEGVAGVILFGVLALVFALEAPRWDREATAKREALLARRVACCAKLRQIQASTAAQDLTY